MTSNSHQIIARILTEYQYKRINSNSSLSSDDEQDLKRYLPNNQIMAIIIRSALIADTSESSYGFLFLKGLLPRAKLKKYKIELSVLGATWVRC